MRPDKAQIAGFHARVSDSVGLDGAREPAFLTSHLSGDAPAAPQDKTLGTTDENLPIVCGAGISEAAPPESLLELQTPRPPRAPDSESAY